MTTTSEFKITDDFSLVQGGALFQLFVRSHLATTGLDWLKRRIIFFVLLTWLPLLLLSVVSGHLLDGNINVPFLYDLETHVRFLVALPLLLVAEFIVHQRIKPVIQQFIERGIIPAETKPRFDACIVSALRLRNSVWMETGLVAFVMCYHFVWSELATLDTTIWYASGVASKQQLSLSGYWFAYISLPVFQFLMFRWVVGEICVFSVFNNTGYRFGVQGMTWTAQNVQNLFWTPKQQISPTTNTSNAAISV